MVTRIDKLLGTEIFQLMQDVVPRNIGIMVGIAHTSGKLVTGKRKYEMCRVCRELINPCITKRSHSCEETPPCGLRRFCHGGIGNSECTESDRKHGNHARRTNMTVLYRCFFGMANFAIPVKIGGLASIILYGGQFKIEKSDEEEKLIVDYRHGSKIQISESEFRKVVLATCRWRRKRMEEKGEAGEESAHLPLGRRKQKLLDEYKQDCSVDEELPKTIRTIEIPRDGKKHSTSKDLDIGQLEDLLRNRWGLSVFEAWDEFIGEALSERTIEDNGKKLSSYYFKEHMERGDLDLPNAKDAYAKYEAIMKSFLRDPTPPKGYGDGIIPLKKAFDAIEFLKELANLISMTANVVFYKDTYFGLRRLWDNHPISSLESFQEYWIRCESLLEQLDTTGRDMPLVRIESLGSGTSFNPDAQGKHLEIVEGLTKNMMFFVYKLLSDNFSSTIENLLYNYEVGRLYSGYAPDAVKELIKQTEKDFGLLETVSCLFIMDLLDAKYEHLNEELSEGKLSDPKVGEKKTKLEHFSDRIKEWSSPTLDTPREDLINTIRSQLEAYSEKAGAIDDFQTNDCCIEWKREIFGLLHETVEEDGWVEDFDIMLRFFDLILGKKKTEYEFQEELDRISVNFRWANTVIERQVENLSTSVLQFDVGYSFLQFLQRLREDVYTKRFEIFRSFFEGPSRRDFEHVFMPPQKLSPDYFIDHGITHATRVLQYVEAIIGSACRREADKPEQRAGEERVGFGSVLAQPLWQYYVKRAALLHDVGMFSAPFYDELYGGPLGVRRCHGAFSAKRIVEQSRFQIFGNELDRRIIAEICAFHQGRADISGLDVNIRPLVAILRIADEFDVGNKRFRKTAQNADVEEIDVQKKFLQDDIKELNKKEGSHLELEGTSPKKKELENLERDILELAKEKDRKLHWPPDDPCIEFVQTYPTDDAKTRHFVNVLRRISRITDALGAAWHHEKHKSVEDVRISVEKRGEKTYLVPEILMAKISSQSSVESVPIDPKKQSRIVAERVKIKFEKEIQSVRDYLEPLGLHFLRPRIAQPNGEMRNILFINAPSCRTELKFTGAPTSLLYAIAPIAAIVDRVRDEYKYLKSDSEDDFNYDDVNMELWDPGILNEETKTELGGIIDDVEPRIVGISNTSASHSNAVEIAKIIKARRPDTIVIFGGPHENVCFSKTIYTHKEHVDISIGGIKEPCTNGTGDATHYQVDAEYAFREIILRILSENDRKPNLRKILHEKDLNNVEGKFGIAFYDGNKIWERDYPNCELKIDGLPIAPRYLLNHDAKYDYTIFRNKITGKLRKTAQIITTRGCRHECTFCSSSGRRLRRNTNNVVAELEYLKKEGYEAIFFDDSTFADECGRVPQGDKKCRYIDDFCPKSFTDKDEFAEMNKENIYAYGQCGYGLKLCNQIEASRLGLIWGCQTRADTVFEQLVGAMKKAGCEYIYFGVESLSDKTLEEMHKGLSTDKIKDGIRAAASGQINVGISVVFGLEQENFEGEISVKGKIPKSAKDTIDGLADMLWGKEDNKIGCVSINIATAYPGTALERQFEDKGVKEYLPNFDNPPFRRLNEYPHNRFEEAGWNILPFLAIRKAKEAEDRDVTEAILEYCKEKIRGKLVIDPV